MLRGLPAATRDAVVVERLRAAGAVVSVIDGMAEIAISSDTGGSIRIPSALSGAVGSKPSRGRVPTTGAFSLSSSLDTLGPIATSVRDCALADQVRSGESDGELNAVSTDSFKLTVARGRLFDRCEPAVLAAFDEAMARLRQAGCRYRWRRLPRNHQCRHSRELRSGSVVF